MGKEINNNLNTETENRDSYFDWFVIAIGLSVIANILSNINIHFIA